jgi:hypothetical protein
MAVLIAILLALVPAAAAAAPRQAQKPTDLICRDITETGSRLASNRVCMTRAQWEEQRRSGQRMIEKAQEQQINRKG